jgi:CDP-paratose 2-epimerase
MSVAVITGSSGLVGSEAVQYFASLGMDIAGIDNGMRAKFFGENASTAWMTERLTNDVRTYRHHQVDIRDASGVGTIFAKYGRDISLVIHAAAQPSHDWAANDPVTDFTVNANGTSVLLEATRQHAPEAVFIYMSTNKVYGDRPNSLPLIEKSTRWEIDPSHAYSGGIPETMSIDATLHSLFGASKVAADVLVQEYGRYFGMKTTCFRGGCLTGPNHSGTQLHGFLAYLMKCAVTSEPYKIFGYKGKQVRDNIHSADLVRAFHAVYDNPHCGEVYNIGGGRDSNCSMLEAIAICEEITGQKMQCTYLDGNRRGDHIWWISDLRRFRKHYPSWNIRHGVRQILSEILDANVERWREACAI